MLEDDDPDAVETMCHFFRTFEYHHCQGQNAGYETMSADVEVCILADKVSISTARSIKTPG